MLPVFMETIAWNASTTGVRQLLGAYGEHQWQRATVDGEEVAVDDKIFTVRLAPGAGARLTMTQRRYANRPSFGRPWE